VLGPVWDEVGQRWWLGPTEDLLRQAMDEGGLVATDSRLLATALLGSLTALGRVVAAQPEDPQAGDAAERVMLTLTTALQPWINPRRERVRKAAYLEYGLLPSVGGSGQPLLVPLGGPASV